MVKEHPGCITQLNMLPMGALADPRGHAEDWINAAGKGNLRYLSFDQYPFGLQAGSVPQMFPNMNLVRETGLKYNVDTALYIQSIGVVGSFRRPTVSETRYHTSAALAYGFKNLKYFTWITPVERSEEFTPAIIAPDGSKTDSFDSIASINKDIKKVSKILGNLDAVEIYHNGRSDMATTMLEPGWFVESTDKKDFLVSLMVDRKDGRNYLMVVNKNYKDDVTLSLKLNGISNLTDVTSGSDESAEISDGKVSCQMLAGGFRLYRLDEGISLKKEIEEEPNTNLALDKPVYSVSSLGQNGYYNYKVVDGSRSSSSSSRGWRYEGKGNEEIYVTIDLKKVTDINRVDLYPVVSANEEGIGVFFPKKYTIMYSENGKDYKKILDATYDSGKTPSHKFDAVKARYVKIVFDDLIGFGDMLYAEVAEIEVYNDNGTVPEYVKPAGKDNTLVSEYNVALRKKTKTSTSLEVGEWGWSKVNLNDGKIGRTDTHTGWTTQTKLHIDDPYANEWVIVELGSKYNIDTVVLYPRQDSGAYFPKKLTIEISNDNRNWTVVYEHSESGAISSNARVLKFNAVDATYVRIASKEMTQDAGSPDGYLFQLAEVEVYRTGRTAPKEDNKNKVLNCPTFVSSTGEYVMWGWSQTFINDGVIAQSDKHAGFTTLVGTNKDDPKKGEWITFMLGSEKTVSKVVLYPANSATYFSKGFIVEVSEDGKTFKKVAEYKETDNSMEPRTVTFSPISALFVRITTTELRQVTTSPDGYLFQVAEIEIY